MNNFLVKRAFLIGGAAVPVGDVVNLTDAELARQLLNAEKIEPADDDTATRWTKKQANSWKPVPKDSKLLRRE